TDDELAGLDRRHGAADLFDDAAVLVAHRRRLGGRVNAAVGPQVGAAHAGGREPNDGIRRLDDCWLVALLEAHIARAVEHSSSHDVSPSLFTESSFTSCSRVACRATPRCERYRVYRPSLPNPLA